MIEGQGGEMEREKGVGRGERGRVEDAREREGVVERSKRRGSVCGERGKERE